MKALVYVPLHIFFFSSFSFLQGLVLGLPLDSLGCSVPLVEALGHFMPISKAIMHTLSNY